MTSPGRVRIWHDDQGWGVIDSEATPGGCWTHYSSLLVDGFQTLAAGQEVTFTFEAIEQDGYPFRAVQVWPADRAPVPTREKSEPSTAYHSTLNIAWDEEDQADRS